MSNFEQEIFATKYIEKLMRNKNLGSDLKLNFYDSWKFPDEFIYSVNKGCEKVVSLSYKNKAIAVLDFKISTAKKDHLRIDLKFIQGVNSGIDSSILKKLNWKEPFIESFLEPAITYSLQKNATIVYSDVVNIKEEQGYFEKKGFKPDNIKEFVKKYSKEESYRELTPKEFNEVCKNFECLVRKSNFINFFRDRYFLKNNGKLNPEKKKVKNLIASAKNNLKYQQNLIKKRFVLKNRVKRSKENINQENLIALEKAIKEGKIKLTGKSKNKILKLFNEAIKKKSIKKNNTKLKPNNKLKEKKPIKKKRQAIRIMPK